MMGYWETTTGEVLKVEEMATSHIVNARKQLERRLSTKPGGYVYIGDNWNSERAVEEENRINDEIAEKISELILMFDMELERRAEDV